MFWEASALVPVLLDEPDSSAVVSSFDGDREPVIWWATPVESHSAIARALRERRISRAEATAAIERLRTIGAWLDEIGPSEDLRSRAIRLLTVHQLRAGDALQLAAALVWSEEQPSGETFACLDRRLREAARREGFALYPPE